MNDICTVQIQANVGQRSYKRRDESDVIVFQYATSHSRRFSRVNLHKTYNFFEVWQLVIVEPRNDRLYKDKREKINKLLLAKYPSLSLLISTIR